MVLLNAEHEADDARIFFSSGPRRVDVTLRDVRTFCTHIRTCARRSSEHLLQYTETNKFILLTAG